MKPQVIILLLLFCLPSFAEEVNFMRFHSANLVGYGTENYGYELSFETENLNIIGESGEGKLLTLTLVVPKKGNRRTSLPLGEFHLGTCDSLQLNSIDYYASCAEYYGKYNLNYRSADLRVPILHCDVNISKLKANKLRILLNYELANGERGEYLYEGKVKIENKIQKLNLDYIPKKPQIKNWQLTSANISINDTTAYNSRLAILQFECEYDMMGEVVFYAPLDSINGRFELKYGKEQGTAEPGEIEDFVDGWSFFLVDGYMTLTDEKLFFEFTCLDGSIVRGFKYGGLCVQ